MNNCDMGGCPQRGRACVTCASWTPSRNSRYYRCGRFAASHVGCDQPKDACATCSWYEPPDDLGPGRPNFSGINWQDPVERAEYMEQWKASKHQRKTYMTRRRRKLLEAENP